MIKITVTKAELETIRASLNDSPEPYRVALEYGFPGFAGGLDHIDENPWSITLVDRGLSSGGGYKDNTTRFVVPMKERT